MICACGLRGLVAGEFTKLVLRECWTPCTMEVLRLWAYEWEGLRSRAPSGLELLLLLGMAMPGTLVREDMRPRVTLGSREGACRACACECEAAVQVQESAKPTGTPGCITGRPNKLGHDTTAAGSFKHRPVWMLASSGKVPKTPQPLRRRRHDSKRKSYSHMGTHGRTRRSSSGSTEGISACGRGERHLPLGRRQITKTPAHGASCS